MNVHGYAIDAMVLVKSIVVVAMAWDGCRPVAIIHETQFQQLESWEARGQLWREH
jgi:hypothetical protein